MGDHLDELCALVEEAGGTMRLHGQPVTADQLRKTAAYEAEKHLITAALRGEVLEAWIGETHRWSDYS